MTWELVIIIAVISILSFQLFLSIITAAMGHYKRPLLWMIYGIWYPLAQLMVIIYNAYDSWHFRHFYGLFEFYEISKDNYFAIKKAEVFMKYSFAKKFISNSVNERYILLNDPGTAFAEIPPKEERVKNIDQLYNILPKANYWLA